MTSPETSRTERISTFFHTALGWYWFFCGCLWCFCCFLCRESRYLPHSPRRSAAVLIACSSAFENILRRVPCAAAQSHYWLCAAPVSITAFWPQGARCSTLPSLCSRPWPSSFFPFSFFLCFLCLDALIVLRLGGALSNTAYYHLVSPPANLRLLSHLL